MTMPKLFSERFGSVDAAGRQKVVILYDGACPFCSSYVSFLKLRKMAEVTLVDARTEPAIVAELGRHGISLDEGMLTVVDDEPYHGAAALAAIARLTGDGDAARLLNKALFSSPNRSRALYPLLKFGRSATLKLLGRKRL